MKPSNEMILNDFDNLHGIIPKRLRYYLYHNLIKVKHLKKEDRYKYVLTSKGMFLKDVLVTTAYSAIESALEKYKKLSFTWIDSVLVHAGIDTQKEIDDLLKNNVIKEGYSSVYELNYR